jgi:CxxC motif-containing protein
MEVTVEEDTISVKGNTCKRGEAYAENEIRDPQRVITTTARVINGDSPVVSVKTDRDISKKLMFDVVKEINKHSFPAPVHIGDILIEDIFDTGVNIVATRSIKEQ